MQLPVAEEPTLRDFESIHSCNLEPSSGVVCGAAAAVGVEWLEFERLNRSQRIQEDFGEGNLTLYNIDLIQMALEQEAANQ